MNQSRFHQAARASWIAPLIAIGANTLIRSIDRLDSRVVITGLLLLALYGIGLCLGIGALFGIPRHGRTGILLPALIGILLNSLILFLSLGTLLR